MDAEVICMNGYPDGWRTRLMKEECKEEEGRRGRPPKMNCLIKIRVMEEEEGGGGWWVMGRMTDG